MPRLRVIVAQVLVALGCIVVGARVFVGAVEDIWSMRSFVVFVRVGAVAL